MRMASEAVSSGAARQRLLDIVAAQGGDVRLIENTELLPKASHVTPLAARRSGIVVRADAWRLGTAARALGAGRLKVEDAIDPAAGLVLHKKVGNPVRKGEPLCDLHWNDEGRYREALPHAEAAFEIRDKAVRPRPLIWEVLQRWTTI
jgi:pyrimidine-nucleoside phosphorylase